MPLTLKEFKEPQTIFEIWNFIKGARFLGPVRLPRYTETEVLTLSREFIAQSEPSGTIIHVTDGTSGTDMIRYWNGTAFVALG